MIYGLIWNLHHYFLLFIIFIFIINFWQVVFNLIFLVANYQLINQCYVARYKTGWPSLACVYTWLQNYSYNFSHMYVLN